MSGAPHGEPVTPRTRLDQALARLPLPDRFPTRFALRILIAFLATNAIFAIILALLGTDIVSAFDAIFQGAFGTKFNFGQTIMIASLLAATGLAAAIPFKAHLWNVGGEGQMWFGAFVTLVLAFNMPESVATGLGVAICIAGAMVGGAVWGFVPGILKATIGANEVITSLMMTFVAIEIGNWAITEIYPAGATNQTETIPLGVTMPPLVTGTLVTIGAPLAVLAVVIAWVVMKRTRLGFEINATGLNAGAARMNGMSIKRVSIVTFVLGGAFAGLAGGVFILGINNALPAGFSLSNFGFLGIAVALVARLNPAWIIPSALLFAALRVGSDGLQAATGLSTTVGQILVAVFVVLLLTFGLIRFTYPEASR